jgi:hypothetical protein
MCLLSDGGSLVGRRWLLPCLLTFHIIFLTTLIASHLFLQCLVPSSHHLITAARSMEQIPPPRRPKPIVIR